MKITEGHSTFRVTADKENQVIVEIGYSLAAEAWCIDVRTVYANPPQEQSLKASTWADAHLLAMQCAQEILTSESRRRVFTVET